MSPYDSLLTCPSFSHYLHRTFPPKTKQRTDRKEEIEREEASARFSFGGQKSIRRVARTSSFPHRAGEGVTEVERSEE